MNPGRFYPSAHGADSTRRGSLRNAAWERSAPEMSPKKTAWSASTGRIVTGGPDNGCRETCGHNGQVLPGRTWRDRNSLSLLIIEDEAGRWWFREDLWICVTVRMKQTACFDVLRSLVYDCFTVCFISEVELWVHVTVCSLKLGESSVLHSPCLLYLHTADSVIIRWRWRLGWLHCCSGCDLEAEFPSFCLNVCAFGKHSINKVNLIWLDCWCEMKRERRAWESDAELLTLASDSDGLISCVVFGWVCSGGFRS